MAVPRTLPLVLTATLEGQVVVSGRYGAETRSIAHGDDDHFTGDALLFDTAPLTGRRESCRRDPW